MGLLSWLGITKPKEQFIAKPVPLNSSQVLNKNLLYVEQYTRTTLDVIKSFQRKVPTYRQRIFEETRESSIEKATHDFLSHLESDANGPYIKWLKTIERYRDMGFTIPSQTTTIADIEYVRGKVEYKKMRAIEIEPVLKLCTTMISQLEKLIVQTQLLAQGTFERGLRKELQGVILQGKVDLTNVVRTLAAVEKDIREHTTSLNRNSKKEKVLAQLQYTKQRIDKLKVALRRTDPGRILTLSINEKIEFMDALLQSHITEVRKISSSDVDTFKNKLGELVEDIKLNVVDLENKLSPSELVRRIRAAS